MKKPLVSIIIRVKNEEKWINSCLRSIYKQKYENFEVVLVDNKSSDNTIAKAKQFPLKIIEIDNYFPGKAINEGVKVSKGEIIVCLSGHCIPKTENWLSSLIFNLENDNIGGVYGRQEPLSFSSPFDKRDLIITFGLDKKIQIKDYFFHNANSAFKRSIWEKFPFDEKINNLEDRLWAKKIINANYKIIYEPEASVYHYHGIHQNLDFKRANNIAKIMESIEDDNYFKKKINLEDLKISCLIPTKGSTYISDNKDLLDYAIKDASECKYIKDIFIASDNQEMIKLKEKTKVKDVFIRPIYLSEEYISIIEVIDFMLEKVETNYYLPDLLVIMDPSHPFRPKNIVAEMLQKLVKNGSDSIIAVKSELRKLWNIKTGESTEISEEDFLPRQFRNDKVFISLLGLCFITYPKFIRDTSVFGNKLETFEVKSPLSSLQLREQKEIKEIGAFLENWIENRDK